MYAGLHFSERVTPGKSKDLFRRIASTATVLSPRAVDKPLALYGAGNLGRMARDYLDRVGVPLQFVVDVNAARLRADPYWAGVELLTPDEVPAERRGAVLLAVSVVTAPYAELAQQLAAAGWNDAVPFYDIAESFRHRHPLANGWFAAPFSANDAACIEQALEAWSDDVSRAHHLQFLAWRRLRQEWLFDSAPVHIDDRFFIPEVMAALTNREAFVDLGAHTGSVTRRFVEMTHGDFARIWAIEPDAENRAGLEALVAALAPEIRSRIEIIPTAVASDRTPRKFLGGLGYASQFCHLGAEISCDTLDDLGLNPSYIKLHLEGSELEALRGAMRTIARCRPIVAATSYHSAEGVSALPLWLGMLDNYRLLMRMHGWCGTGAVVYAIPGERFKSARHNGQEEQR